MASKCKIHERFIYPEAPPYTDIKIPCLLLPAMEEEEHITH